MARVEDVGDQLEVFFKVACSPAPRIIQFLLAVYVGNEGVVVGGGSGIGGSGVVGGSGVGGSGVVGGAFLLNPLQIWSVHVHCLQRVDLSPLQGTFSFVSICMSLSLPFVCILIFCLFDCTRFVSLFVGLFACLLVCLLACLFVC